jgi:hypothetical protein
MHTMMTGGAPSAEESNPRLGISAHCTERPGSQKRETEEDKVFKKLPQRAYDGPLPLFRGYIVSS